jgi:transposase
MAKRTKRKFSNDFKLKVALQAIKEEKTVTALCQEHQLFPAQIKEWKQQLLDHLPAAFDGGKVAKESSTPALITQRETELFEQIGRLKMELEWLKKKFPGI